MVEGLQSELHPPQRVLLGPGPSNVHPRVQRALLLPPVGYADPYFFQVMDDTMSLLRRVFQTENTVTLPISGTGSAGMEACLANILEPGEVAVVGVNGYFGERLVEVASRCGAEVVAVPADWGRTVDPDALEAALKKQKRVKVLALVHAETSTGVLQPLTEASRLAKAHDAFFLVDAVTSLGGCEVAVDRWGIDLCYSASQKCLSCPPGLAPVTANEGALAAISGRRQKVQSFYLDLRLLRDYWTGNHIYHHTAPISMVYALREALAMVAEEGLEARYHRHHRHGHALQAGLEAMGLRLHAEEGHRLPVLTSVRVPNGVEEARVRQALLHESGIEIGAGLGPLRGKIWRIGLMGHASSEENVLLVLSALEVQLRAAGHRVAPGQGVVAALGVLRGQPG